MNSQATILLAERARWFRALASPSRLRILELLRESDLCACDIQMELNLPRTELKHHLAALETAQLILSFHDGSWCYYSIVAENLRQLSEYLEFLGEPLLLPAPYCGSPEPSGNAGSLQSNPKTPDAVLASKNEHQPAEPTPASAQEPALFSSQN